MPHNATTLIYILSAATESMGRVGKSVYPEWFLRLSVFHGLFHGVSPFFSQISIVFPCFPRFPWFFTILWSRLGSSAEAAAQAQPTESLLGWPWASAWQRATGRGEGHEKGWEMLMEFGERQVKWLRDAQGMGTRWYKSITTYYKDSISPFGMVRDFYRQFMSVYTNWVKISH